MSANLGLTMLHILLISWSILSVFGKVQFNHKTFLDNEENVELLWQVVDDMMIFEVRAYTTGYVAIGFSPNGGMKGADIMIASVTDGTPYISDRHSIGNEEPEIDIQNDYDLLYGSEADGLTTIGYQRKLITCDMDDYDITADTVRVIWSYHPDDAITYHGPHRRGVRSIIFVDGVSANLNSLPDNARSFDVLVENYIIPSDTATTYWVTHVELPQFTNPQHVIRIEPIVQPGNEGIVHHLVIKVCVGLRNINGSRSLHYKSKDMYQFTSCYKMIYAWAVGGGPLEFPENVGYPLTGQDSVKYLQLTVHYDNAQLLTGINDSSGVRIHYTPTLRQYDSGLLMVGLSSLSLFVIPPKEEAFPVYGSCVGKCSQQLFSEGDVKIFAVFLHAHLAGVSMRLTHYRNGEYIGDIVRDKTYDFNLQESRYLKQHWIVKPGDDLIVECTYNTMDRETTTFGGLASTDEMCLAFLFYYPKSNAGLCYSIPTPESLEERLNLVDLKNKTLREAIQNMEWTRDRRDAVVEWWYEMPRMSKCTNYSGQPVFPEQDLITGNSQFVETKSLRNIIDIQSKTVDNDKCSNSPMLKAAWLTMGILALAIHVVV